MYLISMGNYGKWKFSLSQTFCFFVAVEKCVPELVESKMNCHKPFLHCITSQLYTSLFISSIKCTNIWFK